MRDRMAGPGRAAVCRALLRFGVSREEAAEHFAQ
jgi:hypothetical protein